MRSISLVLPILMSLAVVASATPVSNAAKPLVTKRASGDFSYTFTEANGVERRQVVNAMRNLECMNVIEAVAEGTEPVHSPLNQANQKVYLFKEIDCDGPYQVLRPGGNGGVDMKFRSILFSN